jgi:hypothetical protein
MPRILPLVHFFKVSTIREQLEKVDALLQASTKASAYKIVLRNRRRNGSRRFRQGHLRHVTESRTRLLAFAQFLHDLGKRFPTGRLGILKLRGELGTFRCRPRILEPRLIRRCAHDERSARAATVPVVCALALGSYQF